MAVAWPAVLLLALCAVAGARGATAGVVAGHSQRYEAEVGALLAQASDAPGAGPGPSKAETAYRARAELQVSVYWPPHPIDPPPDDLLLHFELSKLQLLGGAEWRPREAQWPQGGRGVAHLRRGEVVQVLLPGGEPKHVQDLTRALISLFQFQMEEGERNETDASGACRVRYERPADREVRKMKGPCAGDDVTGAVTSRRSSRHALGDDGALRSARADETHELRAPTHAGVGVKARAWAQLRLLTSSPAPSAAAPAPASLDDALASLQPQMQRTSLEIDGGASADDDEDAPSDGWMASVAQAPASWEAGAFGRASDARSFLRARSLCRLSAPRAERLLRDASAAQQKHTLTELLRVFGLCCSAGTHGAAGALLQLRSEPAVDLAKEYLAAVALAPTPHESVVADVLQLGLGSGPLATTALLAGCAAAARLPRGADDAKAKVVAMAAKCRDDECRRRAALALGNLRRATAADALLAMAERAAPTVALAAVDALSQLPPATLPFRHSRRLFAVALNASRPLELRAAALELAWARSRHAPPVAWDTMRQLHSQPASAPAHELRRLLRQRLSAAAEDRRQPMGAHVATVLLRQAKGDAVMGSWAAVAGAGTTSVLVRDTRWRMGRWAALLDSVQVAEGGLLRRGTVRLVLSSDDEHEAVDGQIDPARLLHEAQNHVAVPALALHVWTRGLAALAPAAAAGGPEASGEPEDAAAGLDIEVAGVRFEPITLFTGQGELLGHLWAGTGSSPTPVLRAMVPAPEVRLSVALVSGARVRLRALAAAAVALDASAAASLWSRTATTRLRLRIGAVAEADAHLRLPRVTLSTAVAASAEPRLSIAADLDFYDAVQLCVRVKLDDHLTIRNATASSVVGAGFGPRRWSSTATSPSPGRSLALGALNDRACATLAASDQHD